MNPYQQNPNPFVYNGAQPSPNPLRTNQPPSNAPYNPYVVPPASQGQYQGYSQIAATNQPQYGQPYGQTPYSIVQVPPSGVVAAPPGPGRPGLYQSLPSGGPASHYAHQHQLPPGPHHQPQQMYQQQYPRPNQHQSQYYHQQHPPQHPQQRPGMLQHAHSAPLPQVYQHYPQVHSSYTYQGGHQPSGPQSPYVATPQTPHQNPGTNPYTVPATHNTNLLSGANSHPPNQPPSQPPSTHPVGSSDASASSSLYTRPPEHPPRSSTPPTSNSPQGSSLDFPKLQDLTLGSEYTSGPTAPPSSSDKRPVSESYVSSPAPPTGNVYSAPTSPTATNDPLYVSAPSPALPPAHAVATAPAVMSHPSHPAQPLPQRHSMPPAMHYSQQPPAHIMTRSQQFAPMSSPPPGVHPLHTSIGKRPMSAVIFSPSGPGIATSSPPPPPQQAQQQLKGQKSGMEKFVSSIGSKIVEMASMTSNAAKNRVAAFGSLLSGTSSLEGLKPPKNSYTEQAFELYRPHISIDRKTFEQLYYLFRNLCESAEKDKASQESFSKLFPATTNRNVIRYLFRMFLDSDTAPLDFASFISTLSVTSAGFQVDKLKLVWALFSDHGREQVTRNVLTTKGSIIAYEMAESGFYGKLRAKEVEKTMLATFSQREPNDPIPLEEFITSGGLCADLINCFGAMRFVNKHTVERVMAIPSQKEGFLLKHYKNLVEKWTYHWCCVAGGLFYYYNDLENYVQAERVIPLVNCSVERISVPGKIEFGFKLSVGEYSRKFGCHTEEELQEWINIITTNNSVLSQNRFESSFPVRSGVKGDFYVDGAEGFAAITMAIRGAKESIFISDWFFSPELIMIRHPAALDVVNRLDFILKQKAEEGVKICILVWSETKIAVGLNSENVQAKMSALHKNISVQRHPLNYPLKWSHHQKIVVVDQNIAFVGGLDLCFGRFDDQNHYITDPDSRIWPGKDYYNPVFAPFENVEEFSQDSVDRKRHPRMGWHDVHMRVEGIAARDVARNFIERWNYAKIDLERISTPFLVPKTTISAAVNEGTLQVQVLRSLGGWHLPNFTGCPERSIYKAYLHHISHAKHFIYIENQYFISSLAGEPVWNEIGKAILDRIRQAILQKEVFRVIVVLPVHPDGTYKDDAGIRYIMEWQYKTINRGEQSILKQLIRDFPGINLDDYIVFNALRKSEFIYGMNFAVTEQIYVHSKIMIVDDRVAIIGSANINDRSFDGDRDSEIACVVEDDTEIDTTMNGQPHRAGRYAFELRKKLWREHLGLPTGADGAITDPIVPSVWTDLWIKTSRKNTEIFRQVFPLAPDDSIESLQQMEDQQMTDTTAAQILLNGIRGHLIDFPLNFLKNMSLAPGMSDVDLKMLDDDTFT